MNVRNYVSPYAILTRAIRRNETSSPGFRVRRLILRYECNISQDIYSGLSPPLTLNFQH